jgi:GNAT superfamily N-acetyltransferase
MATRTHERPGRALTRGGATTMLRPLEGDDAEAVGRLLFGLSPTSAYRRFLGSSRTGPAAYVSRLRSAAQTLAATVALEHGVVVGVASLHPDREGTAEVALAVADQEQGEGIGTLLLEDLVDRARCLGLTRLSATVLAENAEMLTVFRDLGLNVTIGRPDAGVMDVCLDLAPSAIYDQRLVERTVLASAASVRRVLHPSSVCLIHDHRGRKAARQAWRHLRDRGFGGALTLARWQDQIPSDTDVTVVFGAPSRIAQLVEKCADAGAAAIVWPDRDRAPDQVRSRVARACTTAATVLLGPASRLDVGPDPDLGFRADDWSRLAGRHAGIVVVGSDHLHPLVRALDRCGIGVSTVLDVERGHVTDWSAAVAAALLDPHATAVVLADPPADLPDGPPLVPAQQQGKPVVVFAPDGDVATRDRCTLTVRRPSDVAAALAVWARTAQMGVRARVLVVGDGATARTVRDACASAGVLSANLTQQAERRLRFTVPAVVVDGNALLWTTATSSDIKVTLDTVVDCPEVDVVIVALDPPRSRADRVRCRRVQDECRRVQVEASLVSGGAGVAITACIPGGVVSSSLPTFSSAYACAAALSLAGPRR